MGYEDRPYFRDGGNTTYSPLQWLMYGSVPLFTAFGIRVRAHATLIIYIALVLLVGFGQAGFAWQDRVGSGLTLFIIVLLHEFGHCFTARWVGGEAEDILMHPLGGLAMARPPHRPLPMFLTSAGGPAVNVVICIFCALILYHKTGRLPSNPFIPRHMFYFIGWLDPTWLAFWFYQTSYMLLCFNLLPIFPLDGGQMTQAILWKPLGYYKSMLYSCNVGMVAAVIAGMVALASGLGNLGLAILAVMGFMCCLNMRRAVLAAGPEMEGEGDYSAAYEKEPLGLPRRNRWAARKAVKAAYEEEVERRRIDTILDKVSHQGMPEPDVVGKARLAEGYATSAAEGRRIRPRWAAVAHCKAAADVVVPQRKCHPLAATEVSPLPIE